MTIIFKLPRKASIGFLRLLIFLPHLTGCATILSDKHQLIHIDTHPIKNANCIMSNSKGSFIVHETPGATMVHKAYGDLNVQCQKNGCLSASSVVKSSSDGATWGNLLLGGGIGAIVDAKSGAGYSYPSIIHIPMKGLD